MRTLIYLTTFIIWALGAKAAEIALPVSQEEITIQSKGYKLFGTLQSPESKKNLSILLLISGSGPTDRDGNQPNLTNNSMKYLAEELAQNGVASVRYDKRGIAKSAVPGFSNASVIFEDYVTDATNWVKHLKAQNKYAKVYVAGLSEGSLIGMLAAQRAGADGFISLNGTGRTADEIIVYQISKQGTPQPVIDELKGIIKKLKNDEEIKDVPPYLMSLFNPDIQPYMKSWFSYEPAVSIGLLDKPVLIIQGKNDIQVEVLDAELLKKGSKNGKLVLVDGMNHILKNADSDPQLNFATYNNPELPLNTTVLSEILKFIQP